MNDEPKLMKSQITERYWVDFLEYAKTMNAISKAENDKYFAEHSDEEMLAPPYQTMWVNEQNFWQWYMDTQMPEVKVQRQTKKSKKKDPIS